MSTGKQQDVASLRKQLSNLQRSRAGCRGDPEALRDLDDLIAYLKSQIARLRR